MAAPPPPASTITVYGPDDQPVEVPAAEAAALLRSGQYGLPESAAVPVQKADGSWETVTGAEAVQRAQSFSTRLGSAADVQDYQKSEEFRGLGNKALAAGSGLVDSALLGFGDAAVVKGAELIGKGDEARAFLQDADRYAPGSRMAGQAAGFLLPLVATGGSSSAATGASVAGRAARVATALPRGLTAVAEGAGSLASRAVGGGLPGRFIAPVVSQGLELGVYGAGQRVSQTVVRDPQADGAALAAALGQGFLHGGAMGAAFGGAFGLGGVALGLGGRVAQRGADAVKGRVGEFIETTGERVRGLEELVRTGELPGALGERLGAGLDQATGLAEKVTGRAAPEATTLAGKADRLARTVLDVDKAAVEKAIQSTGATDKILQKAEKLGGSREIAARQIVEDLPRLAGKEGKVLTFAEQAEAAQLLRREVGQKVGDALEALDAAGKGISVSVVVKKAQQEVVEDLRKLAGAEGYADRIDSYLASLKSKSTRGRMGLKDFHQQRSFLDDMVFEAKSSNSPARKGLERVRAIMEESFEASASRAAKAAGNDAAKAYKTAKAEYRAAKWVEEATAKGAGRTNANRAIGFSEQVGALTGAVLGGGGVTGLVTSVASAAANRAIKQVGDQTTAAILREMQLGKPLAEAVADVTRRNVGDKVERFFAAAEPVRQRASGLLSRAREAGERAVEVGRAAGRATLAAGRFSARATGRAAEAAAMAAEYDRRRSELLSVRVGGADKVAATAERFRQIGASPEAAQRAAETAARGAELLAKKLPPVRQRMQTLQPELSADRPDPAAMEKWLRLAKVVEQPAVVLDYLADGTLDPEETELFREAHPDTYRQIVDLVSIKVAQETEAGRPLSYEKALALGTLLDVVADPTLDPAFIAAMQRPPQPPTPPLAPSRRAASKAPALFDPRQEI